MTRRSLEIAEDKVESGRGTLVVDGDGAPPDTYNLAWLIFCLLGVGLLFPWNAFLGALDYFGSLYEGFAFAFALSLAYNWPSVIFLLLNIKWGQRFSFTTRVIVCFGVDILVQILVPIVNVAGAGYYVSLAITLVGVFFTGCATATLFGTILGLASLFPPKYITAVMSGNGVAGIIAGGLRIITKAAMPDDMKISAVIYFGLAAFTLFLCLAAYFLLLRLPITRYYLAQAERNKFSGSINSEKSMLLEEASTGRKAVHFLPLMKRVWREALVVFSVFFVTLSLFPGLTSQIQTTSSMSQDWFSILMIFNFQVFDYVGRTLPQWFVVFNEKWLWLPTALRAVFFPLFIFCIKPQLYYHDAWFHVFMAIFALTNGYCGTLAMMFGPTNAKDHEKETAGAVMSFFLNFGIFVASHFAILLLYAVKGDLPWDSS